MEIITPQENEPFFDEVSGAPPTPSGPEGDFSLNTMSTPSMKIFELLSKMANQYGLVQPEQQQSRM